MCREFWDAAATAMIVAAIATTPVQGVVSRLASSPPRQHAARRPAEARRGRPRKFSRPSRAVTLTLPDDVIEALRTIDTDLSMAIVRALETRGPEAPRALAEFITCDDDRSVVVVPPSRTLGARTGVDLVPLSDGGALLLLDDRLSIPEFELRLIDALADPTLEDGDRAVFDALAQILRSTRLEEGVEIQQRGIIVLRRTAVAVEGSNGRSKLQERAT
jgi:hypothetical protein